MSSNKKNNLFFNSISSNITSLIQFKLTYLLLFIYIFLIFKLSLCNNKYINNFIYCLYFVYSPSTCSDIQENITFELQNPQISIDSKVFVINLSFFRSFLILLPQILMMESYEFHFSNLPTLLIYLEVILSDLQEILLSFGY